MPGLQIDRRCGSGLQAVLYAAMQVQTGAARVVIAGGVESDEPGRALRAGMRLGVRGRRRRRCTTGWPRAGSPPAASYHPVPGGMLETAENLRREYGISRAGAGRARAALAPARRRPRSEAGRFAEEIVPVTVPAAQGDDPVVVDRDEHPRADTTLEALAALRPVMGRSDPEATVTAGNASGQNDAAALCVVTTRERGRAARAAPAGRAALAGRWPACRRDVMGIGPVPATAQALERAGLTLADIDLIELNEAFAAQVLAVHARVGARRGRLRAPQRQRLRHLARPPGRAPPAAASSPRCCTRWSAARRRYGLETMCIGGGQGLAAVFEAVA